MTINQAGLDLIKEFEGCKLEAYKDSAGVWSIGYGSTARAGVGIEPVEGMTITEAEAEWYLQKALEKFSDSIRPAITAPIGGNEWAAFLSLAYNIGPTAFKKSSALRHFNAGDKAKAAKSILLWNKAGGKVLKGLERRRAAEKKLFETPDPVVAPPAPAGRKNITQSTTVQATAVQVASAAGAGVTAISALDGTVQLAVIGLLAVMVICSAYIFKERLRKWRLGDR